MVIINERVTWWRKLAASAVELEVFSLVAKQRGQASASAGGSVQDAASEAVHPTSHSSIFVVGATVGWTNLELGRAGSYAVRVMSNIGEALMDDLNISERDTQMESLSVPRRTAGTETGAVVKFKCTGLASSHTVGHRLSVVVRNNIHNVERVKDRTPGGRLRQRAVRRQDYHARAGIQSKGHLPRGGGTGRRAQGDLRATALCVRLGGQIHVSAGELSLRPSTTDYRPRRRSLTTNSLRRTGWPRRA